jgi:hypothetical protein
MTATLSNVLDTCTLSSGSFLKTRVMPFVLDTTSTMMALSRTWDRRSFMGTMRGAAAKRMPLEEEPAEENGVKVSSS